MCRLKSEKLNILLLWSTVAEHYGCFDRQGAAFDSAVTSAVQHEDCSVARWTLQTMS